MTKLEQKLLAMVDKGGGSYAFNAGLMRRARSRYGKLYKTNEGLRKAALSLEKKGVVKVKRTRHTKEGEQFTELLVTRAAAEEATSTANVGTYEKPLGAGPLRPPSVLGDYEELLKRLRKKGRRNG